MYENGGMSFFRKGRIFLDYASATPLLSEAKKVMDKYWSKDFYNSSAIYQEGFKVKKDISEYRTRSARLLGVSSDGIVFTASGTEANNLAILGSFEAFRNTYKDKKPHLIISSIEHSSVTSVAEEVVRRGGELSILEVDEEGKVSLEGLKKILKPNTFLVSIGFANGEIGTIQPISKIGRVIRGYRKELESPYPYLHTDASQALNFVDTNLETLHTDLLTIDGSKIYGPKGIGLLALRKNIKVLPIIFGGKQEGGRRAGTLNPALVAGLVVALEVVVRDREKESLRLEKLREEFIGLVKKDLPQAVFNGSLDNHLPNIISVSIPNILSEFIVLKLDKEGILASVGSACSNDEMTSGSPVIRALGRTDLSESTIRFSFGRFTTREEMKKAAKIFCKTVQSVIK